LPAATVSAFASLAKKARDVSDKNRPQIFERSRGYRIEFPNYTTMFCPELLARLGSIVGADNVIVEPLRLH
jgi:hypothetical protein